MPTYKITYTSHHTEEEVTTWRKGVTAQGAIEKLCDQYNWSVRLKMYDADTRGRQWADMHYDPNGGINYNYRIFAEVKED